MKNSKTWWKCSSTITSKKYIIRILIKRKSILSLSKQLEDENLEIQW